MFLHIEHSHCLTCSVHNTALEYSITKRYTNVVYYYYYYYHGCSFHIFPGFPCHNDSITIIPGTTHHSGVITSPVSLNNNYPSNSKCIWQLTAPTNYVNRKIDMIKYWRISIRFVLTRNIYFRLFPYTLNRLMCNPTRLC